MYEIQEMNQEILAATKAKWESEIEEYGEKIYIPQYRQTLKWAEDTIDGNGQDGMCYAILESSFSLEAVAIMEVTHAVPKSDSPWLKILSLKLHPALDSDLSPPKDVLARIATAALIEALGLTYKNHPSNKIKVYGRDSLTTDFLSGIAASLSNLQIKVSQHGNWLIIEK